jgi:sterol desaturase/sphingolipid hydroxylase (fatty acid hydroxylase superfamily)
MIVFWFFLWTLCLYFVHRLAHAIPFIQTIHNDHHAFIANNTPPVWQWNNLLLFNDTWLSTLDLWLTEVLPTIIFAWLTGQWWIMVFYYFWAALLQERIEHNPQFDIFPILPSGCWHLLHHDNCRVNFGPFVVIWDIIFGTYKCSQ